MDLSAFVGLFNILVGVMLVISILCMGAGLMLWYVRLGTYPTDRDQAIKIMQWGVSMLFVLIVLLAVAQFVQTHMALTLMVIGAAGAAAIAYFIASNVLAGGGKEEEHH